MVIIITTLLIAFLQGDSSIPIAFRADKYFPSKNGTSWEYIISGEENAEYIRTISSITETKTGISININTEYKYVEMGIRMVTESKLEYEIDQTGLYDTLAWAEIPDSRVCLIKFPLKSDTEWKDEHPKFTRNCKVLEPERIKIPAGEYLADKVQVAYIDKSTNKLEIVSYEWYVSGIGLVKQERLDKKYIIALKRFKK